MNAKVFVPHPVWTVTEHGRRWKFNIDRVIRDYGAIVPLFADSSVMLTFEVAVREIERELTRNGFVPERDFFLAGGDMTAYGAMLMVAVANWRCAPRQLRFNKREDRYDVLPAVTMEELERLTAKQEAAV